MQAGIQLSLEIFVSCVPARPDEADGAYGKESAFLAQKDLEMGKGREAFLCGCRLFARKEQCAVLLHRLREDNGANGWQVLRNPCLRTVEDEGGIGRLLQAL